MLSAGDIDRKCGRVIPLSRGRERERLTADLRSDTIGFRDLAAAECRRDANFDQLFQLRANIMMLFARARFLGCLRLEFLAEWARGERQ